MRPDKCAQAIGIYVHPRMEANAEKAQNNEKVYSVKNARVERGNVMNVRQSIFLVVVFLTLSSGSWSADFQTGQDAYDSGDYQTAANEWQPLAEAGQASGQFGMGLLFANGFGVSMDDDQALLWYRLAADQGHALAQCNLAVMHANGWGVPQSDTESLKWYRLAADKGIVEAQIAVAKMYERGLGVDEDKVQAYKWYDIAAGMGNDGAPFDRDELGVRMSPEEVANAADLASKWKQNNQNLQANH